MRAIIVAAGPGSRLKPYTDDRPKCLLDIGGRTILQRAIDALRQNGIEEIAVVRGYRSELINYPDVIYYENPGYMENNILESLFCAEAEMDDGFIVSYADILYGGDIVAKLVSSSGDIALVVDIEWGRRYRGRDQHPVAEAELVRVENGRVAAIGKGVVAPEEAYGEFIGLARFSRSGAEAIRAAYNGILTECPDSRFQRSSSLKTAYLSDMFQELIDSGHVVKTVDIEGGWIEIDTPQDLEEARKQFPDNRV